MAKASRRPTEYTVGYDESDKHRQLLGGVVGIGFEHLVDDYHQTGHHHKLHNDADIGGDGVAYERYYHVGKGQHGYNRDAHHDGGLEFGGDGKYRADAEHLHNDGIVLREGIEEHVGILDFFSHKLWI